MKTTLGIGEVMELRRLLTKPTLKSSAESRRDFERYAREKFGVTDLMSLNGRAFLKALSGYASARDLLEHMGYL